MGKDEYHKVEPNIISEESDDEVEEEDNMTIEDDTDEEDVIVDKPSNNEDDEEIPSAAGEGIIEKYHQQGTSQVHRVQDNLGTYKNINQVLKEKLTRCNFYRYLNKNYMSGLVTVTGRL